MRILLPEGFRDPANWGADAREFLQCLVKAGLQYESTGIGIHLRSDGWGDLEEAHWGLGESGTGARFLLAALAFAGKPGKWRSLTVRGTLKDRSSAPLIQTLRDAGVDVQEPEGQTWPTTLMSASMPERLVLVNPISSQEVSSLMLAIACEGRGGLTVQGEIPSQPYVEMTTGVLLAFGARHFLLERGSKRMESRLEKSVPSGVDFPSLHVSPDASSAAVVFVAGLLHGRRVQVPGQISGDAQGDWAILTILWDLGVTLNTGGYAPVRPSMPPDFSNWCVSGAVQRGMDLDLAGTPDLAPPLVALAAALVLGVIGESKPSRFRGLETLDRKESPRRTLMIQALRTLGIEVACEDPGQLDLVRASFSLETLRKRAIAFDVHGDHRMAFFAGLLRIFLPDLEIQGDHKCVGKSWPGFWQALERLDAKP